MKLKLVAINAKYIHSNPAIYSLKAYSGEYDQNVELGEYTINNDADKILADIYKSDPDVLAFSCYIWNIEMVEEIAFEFHKLKPLVPIWVGGPEVSYEVKEYLLNHDWCSGIMIGEGEETFKEVVKHYVTGEPSLDKIKGIAYCEEVGEQRDSIATFKVCQNGYRPEMNMNDIPFYYGDMTEFENRIVYYESSRGCPFSCSYCLSSVDKKLRFRDTETVKQELQFFMDKKVPLVKFVDRTFNCYHEHAMEIWRYILNHDNGITCFHFEISADLLKDEEIDLISQMRPGLIQLEIGVQSTNEDTISEIHRSMKLDLLKDISLRIKKSGNIHQHLDLIAGLPFEGYDSFKKSFDDIYALKPDELQLGFLKVLKGSYMYEHAKEYDILYHKRPPYEVMSTKWLSFDEILKIKLVEEMTEVYYNSGQYKVSIKLLESLFDSAFLMFECFGEYYESKGYLNMSHTRNKRASIMLEFIAYSFDRREDYEVIEAVFKEALTFDLYYRENCKTRPEWAPSVELIKEKTYQYCKNGKTSHVEPFHYEFLQEGLINVTSLPKRLDETVWMLFDYEKRNPLDHQAMVTRVE